VAIGEKLPRDPGRPSTLLTRFGSRRWRIRFSAIATPEIRGLTVAAIFIDHANRSGD